MATVEELIAILGYDIEGEEKLHRFKGSLDNLGKGMAKFATVYAAAAAAAATAVAAGVTWLGKSAVETGIEFENLRTQLVTLTGSSEAAEQSLGWVKEFAKQTPYDLNQTSAAFVKLKAYGIDPTTGALESLGNASSAMNKPLDQAVEALADATTGEFERLKEFGIRTRVEGDKVTFSYLQNGRTITRQVKKDSATIQRALSGIFDERFAGSMERQAKTLQGQWAKLGDTWQQFLLKISDSGLFQAVKNQLERLGNYLERNAAWIETWATHLGQTLGAVVEWIGFAVERTAGHLEWLFTSAEGQFILKSLAAVVIAMGGAFVALAAAIAAVALGLDDLLTYARGGESFFGDWIKWFSEAAGVSTKTAEMITAAFAIVGAALLAAFNPLLGVPVLFATLTVSAAAFQKEINAAFEKLKADIRGVPDAIRAEIGRYFEAAKALGQAIYDGVMAPLYALGGAVVNMLPAIPGAQNFGTGSGTPDAAQWGGGGSSEPWRTGNVGSAISGDMARPNINQSNSVDVGGVNITQHVTNATQAPAAAAQATGAAVAGAASRLNLDSAQ